MTDMPLPDLIAEMRELEARRQELNRPNCYDSIVRRQREHVESQMLWKLSALLDAAEAKAQPGGSVLEHERQSHNEAIEKHMASYHAIATALDCHMRDDFPAKIHALKAELEKYRKEEAEIQAMLIVKETPRTKAQEEASQRRLQEVFASIKKTDALTEVIMERDSLAKQVSELRDAKERHGDIEVKLLEAEAALKLARQTIQSALREANAALELMLAKPDSDPFGYETEMRRIIVRLQP